MCRTTRTAICHSRRRRICSGASRRVELCSNGCVHLLVSMVCFVHLLLCRWHTLVCSLRAHCAHCVGTIRLYPNTRARKMYFTFGNSQVLREALPHRTAPHRTAHDACNERCKYARHSGSQWQPLLFADPSMGKDRHERVSLERWLAHAVVTAATVLCCRRRRT